MSIKKIIKEGDNLPIGYGAAYISPNSFRVILYPIPLNILVSLWRKLLVKLQQGLIESAEFKGYYEGYQKGKKEGLEAAGNKYLAERMSFLTLLERLKERK